MDILLTLARFISPSEQKSVAEKISKMGYKVRSDPLAPERRLLVSGELDRKLFAVEGVSQVIPLYSEENTKTLSEAAKTIADVAKKRNLNEFTIRAKFLGDVPFHQKALRERVKKKHKHTEGPTLYVEAKKEWDYVVVRVGIPMVFHDETETSVILVLESPKTAYEVADFLRMAIVFKVPLRISTEGDTRTVHAISEAKKIVKGYEKCKVDVYPTTKKAIAGLDAAALSLWGDKHESYLKKNKPGALVFGNEERGLKLETQHACNAIIHLGPKSSEPMRATQAAAYALGLMA